MSARETLTFEITANGAQARREFQALSKEAGESLQKVDRSIASYGESLAKIGKGAAVGAAMYGLATAAGRLEDSVQAAGVVFGDSSEKVIEFGENAAESAGLSKQAAVEAATQFGVIGKSVGLAGDDLAGFATTLTQLSGDLASFFGGTSEEAAGALLSGFRGEAEPLKRYSVDVRDATIKTELFRATGERVTGTLTNQQRVLGTYLQVFKSTRDAQGDFARTSEQFMNTQRTLRAQLENTAAALGEAFGPGLSGISRTITGFAKGIADLPEPVKEIGASAVTSYAGFQLLSGGFGLISRGANNTAAKVSTAAVGMRQFGDATASAAASGLKGGTGVQFLGRMSGGAATAVGKLSSGLSLTAGFLGGPWGAAIAAGVAGLSQFGDISNAVTGQADRLQKAYTDMGESTRKFGADSTEALRSFGNVIKQERESFSWKFWEDIGSDFKLIGTSISADVEEIQDAFDGLSLNEQAGQLALLEKGIREVQTSQEARTRFMADQGISTEAEFNERLNDQIELRDRWRTQVEEGTEAALQQSLIQEQVVDALKDEATAAREAAIASGEIEVKMDDLKAAAVGYASGLDDVVGAQQVAAKAGADFSSSLDSISNVDNVVDGVQDLAEAWRALSGEEAPDLSVLKELPDDLAAIDFRTLTEGQSAALDAVQGLGTAMRDQLGNLIATGASYEDVGAKAAEYRNQLITTMSQAGASDAQIKSLLTSLGLMPDQIDTAIQLNGAEKAMAALAVFQADIDNLPPDAKVELLAALNEGDIDRALDIIGVKAAGSPADVPMRPKLDPADWGPERFQFQNIFGGKGKGPEVPVSADTTQFNADIAAATTKSKQKQVVPVGADTGAALTAVAGLGRAISRKETKPITADTGAAVRSVISLNSLIGLAGRKPITADTGAAVRSVISLNSLIGQVSRKPVSLDTGAAYDQLRSLESRIRTTEFKRVVIQQATVPAPGTAPNSLAPGEGVPQRAAAANVTNVTVNLPAGADGADVTRALRRYAARNGHVAA